MLSLALLVTLTGLPCFLCLQATKVSPQIGPKTEKTTSKARLGHENLQKKTVRLRAKNIKTYEQGGQKT